jgi:hypothetical protein
VFGCSLAYLQAVNANSHRRVGNFGAGDRFAFRGRPVRQLLRRHAALKYRKMVTRLLPGRVPNNEIKINLAISDSAAIRPVEDQCRPLWSGRLFHRIVRFSRTKDHRMSLLRVAATASIGLLLGLAPASAAPINPAGSQTIRPHADVEQIYYRHNNDAAVGAAIIGGIVSGVIGSALGGSCYYNDCGYGDDGYYGGGDYGGGGYIGGGRGFRGGGRGFHGGGGGGFHGGGGHASVGHAGGGGGGHGRR